MPTKIAIGNDNMLVYYDEDFQIRDFYYPYVGLENHVLRNKHRIGVFVNNKFSWLNKRDWNLEFSYLEDSLVGEVKGFNKDLNVSINILTAVHHNMNVLMNKLTLINPYPLKRRFKVFFTQHFMISSSNIGDTVYYQPEDQALIYYKGKRYFFIKGLNNDSSFSEYSCGVVDKEKGLEGTWRDAEDGVLSFNPIEHGSVDSAIGFDLEIEGNSSSSLYYWIAADKTYRRAKTLSQNVEKQVGLLLNEVNVYWKRWLRKLCFADLSERVRKLFNHSLLMIKLHTDSQGGILASGDTSIMGFKNDHYSYVWPRDGALVVRALDRMGYKEITQSFFSFCSKVITNDGFMLQKYRPDYSFGSSWHPWVRNGKLQLPIQEDETALVLYALWKNYEKYRDDKFILSVYEELIERPSNFLVSFRDKELKLPSESYDLWEEKLGIHTFTASTVYAGLKAAESFAREFGYDFKKYQKAAEEVREGIVDFLYNKEEGYFMKRIYKEGEEWKEDLTIDASSGYGVFEFGVLDVNDKRVESTMKKIEEELWVKTPIGGLARYKGDKYHRQRIDPNVPGNPWFITTLWLCEYYIKKAKNKEELKRAKELIEWAASYGPLLPEQLNPYDGSPLSATPLTWSHAAFVVAVVKYLEKMEELGEYEIFC